MNERTLPKARPSKTSDYELGTGAPPPRRANGRDQHPEIYAEACRLEPGAWFVWKTAPKSFTAKVRKWAKLSGLELEAYTDTDGRAIVRRRPDGEADDEGGGDGDQESE